MNGDDVKAIFAKLDGVNEGQAKLKAEVAGLSAEVRTSIKQQAAEISALFKYRNEHEKRIAAVERSYVPRSDHDTDVMANTSEHEKFRQAGNEMRLAWGKVIGAAVVIGMAVSALLAWGLSKA